MKRISLDHVVTILNFSYAAVAIGRQVTISTYRVSCEVYESAHSFSKYLGLACTICKLPQRHSILDYIPSLLRRRFYFQTIFADSDHVWGQNTDASI